MIATSGGTLTINGLTTGDGITVSGGDGMTNDNRVFEIFPNTTVLGYSRDTCKSS